MKLFLQFGFVKEEVDLTKGTLSAIIVEPQWGPAIVLRQTDREQGNEISVEVDGAIAVKPVASNTVVLCVAKYGGAA